MNAANDDFEGPLPVMEVRATGRRNAERRPAERRQKAAEAVAHLKTMLSKAGDILADVAVPIAIAIMLAAAGFHHP